jgi:hypothetical protein
LREKKATNDTMNDAFLNTNWSSLSSYQHQTSTVLDSEEVLLSKYKDTRLHVDQLRSRQVEVVYSVDATGMYYYHTNS